MKNIYGSVLLYVIASIVVLASLGAGLVYITSSSSFSELTQTRASQAYYAALSGINYAKALDEVSLDSILAAGGKKFTLDDNKFSLNIVSKSSSCYYAISTGIVAENTNLESRFQTDSICIPVTSTPQNNESAIGSATSSVYLGGDYSGGNIVGNTITIQGGSNITGNLIILSSTATTTVNGSWKGDYICSNGNVVISSDSEANGDIHAAGSVTINNSSLNGNIYSIGNVYIKNGGGNVTGEVHSQIGTELSEWAKINGNVYGNLKIIDNKGTLIGLNKIDSPTKPKSCGSYSLPTHEVYASTNDFEVPDKYIFTGSTNINDHIYTYRKLNVNWKEICFDLSAPNTYINIFVNNSMKIAGKIYVKTSSGDCFKKENLMKTVDFSKSEYAKRIYVDVNGQAEIVFGTQWIGTIFAKNDVITNGDEVIGALYSSEGKINPNSRWFNFKFISSDYFLKRSK